MATSLNPISGPSTVTDPTPQTSGLTKVANQQTFLQLLVAQIKNQNPLNPTDATQFVSQLAQFSELEQMIGVRTEVEGLRKDLEKSVAAKQSAATPQV
jgi:flagellar basal-body rod modification protein FlgD